MNHKFGLLVTAIATAPWVYLRLGVHDANADAEEFDFDVFDDGELFSIVELGWDPGLTPGVPGRPPMGDVHIGLWRQDEREDDRVAQAWGGAFSVPEIRALPALCPLRIHR